MLLTDRDHTVVFQHVSHVEASSDQSAEEVLESGKRSSLNARGLDFAKSPDDEVMLVMNNYLAVSQYYLTISWAHPESTMKSMTQGMTPSTLDRTSNIKSEESQLNIISWDTQ